MKFFSGLPIFAALFFLLSSASASAADGDWPQWRGPRQDGISLETGLAAPWPEDGPTELWRIPLGLGFSSVSVVGDRAYTMFGTEAGEFVVCVDLSDGSVVWKVPSGALFKDEYGHGPRATPTVDEGRVYTLGALGSLLCLDAATGARIWGFNTQERFGDKVVEYGLSASPVIAQSSLIAVVGAQDGKSLVALDKKTGKVRWTSLSDKAGYSTPILVDVAGTRQIVVLTCEAIVGVSAEDGREFWRHPWKTTMDANVATPIFHDGRLFISTGYGTGCGMFQLSIRDGAPAAELLWKNRNMKNYFSSSVLVDGYLYGFNNTMLTCIDFETGDMKWRQRGFNRGSLLVADGKLIIAGERGTLALVEASPDEYKKISSVQIFERKWWTVPTLADGKLLVPNDEELVCLKLKL